MGLSENSSEDAVFAKGGPTFALGHPDIALSDALYAAEQILQRLKSLSESVGYANAHGQFYKRFRVKTEASIREKVSRRRRAPRAKPFYSFRDMTDIIGVRIVTLYDDELQMAIDHVVDLIDSGRMHRQPLFSGANIWESFREAEFYARSASATDIYAVAYDTLRGQILTAGPPDVSERRLRNVSLVTPDERQQHYSSAHLIFDATCHMKNWKLVIPVEFQLRTAIEDIWAEINHELLYKIGNSYVWNVDYASHYSRAKASSDALKIQMLGLPLSILPFRTSSQDAKRALETFSDPDVPSHFSYCVALIQNVAEKHSPLFEELFRKYETVVTELRDSDGSDKQQRVELLQRGAALIESVRRNLTGALTQEKRGATNEISVSALKQRVLLCELEILRLAILLAVQYRASETGGHLRKNAEWRKYCVKLYGRLCALRSRDGWLVRPQALIFYWKYLLARVFDYSLSMTNIESAYDELKFDRSVPEYSIYRVLIPRQLSSSIFFDVGRTIRSLHELEGRASDMHGLSSSLKERLIQALGYALEAFRASRRPHAHRGDIMFGFEDNDSIKDADSVLRICAFLKKEFDEALPDGMPVDRDEIRQVLDFVKDGEKLSQLTVRERKELEQVINEVQSMVNLRIDLRASKGD